MRDVVATLVLVFIVIAVVACCIIFLPQEEKWLYTDTGVCVEMPHGLLSDLYFSVNEETKEIFVHHGDGTRRYYAFEEWYRIEYVRTKSLFQEWTEE